MTTIGIILGSTRPERLGEQVARWVHDTASSDADAGARFELIDLRDHPLPHLDEPLPAARGQYHHEHTKAWAATIAPLDGFVIVTPEYNGFTSGVLKNAIDYLYAEWTGKPVGFVSYGVRGGTGAAAQLRQICGGLKMIEVAQQVTLSLHTEFEDFATFRPSDDSAAALSLLLHQVRDSCASLV
jgi:NAD(P)H-dependent FMN reductase